MFPVPHLGLLASRSIFEECRANNLLEEIDESDITSHIASYSESSSLFILTTSFLTLLFSIFYLCKPPRIYSDIFLLLFEISLYTCAIVTSLAVLWLIAKWKLKALIEKLGAVEYSARKANRVLRERETLAFGLGLHSSRTQTICRRRLFLFCRETIHVLSTFSRSLVFENLMFEEKERLICMFYTDEMRELIFEDVGSDSIHLTQRGIGTLLDLIVLHRSEMLRLIMLYLLHSSFCLGFVCILRLIFHLYSDIEKMITCFNDLAKTLSCIPRSHAEQRKVESETIFHNEMDRVVFSLDDIANGILDGSLSVAEVKRALQRVLSMNYFSDGVTGFLKEETAQPISEKNISYEQHDESVSLNECSGAIAYDEVFEVIASPDEANENIFSCETSDDSILHYNCELMQELRVVLADRAREFAKREQRALADFYATAEKPLHKAESVVKSEAVHEDKGTPSKQSEALESINEVNVRANKENHPSRLPPDLLEALRQRTVVEETIGDS